jgi:hypothetical protein
VLEIDISKLDANIEPEELARLVLFESENRFLHDAPILKEFKPKASFKVDWQVLFVRLLFFLGIVFLISKSRKSR